MPSSGRLLHRHSLSSFCTGSTGQQYSVGLSSISETPIDCSIPEKPCTVILMEDESAYDHGKELTESWLSTFQSMFPQECGISFAYFSVGNNKKKNPTNSDVGTLIPNRVSTILDAMKTSQLPKIRDAVLVARGPLVSLCAQYYLESYPLQGLIMVDPILLMDDEKEEHNDDGDSMIPELLAQLVTDERDIDRFRNSHLMLEPNSVPMMVVRSTVHTAWNQATQQVAARHSQDDGPFGIVPVIDVVKIQEEERDHDCGPEGSQGLHGGRRNDAELMVHLINTWIDDEVL
jgi:hypothetical protein